jgi:hypothetical protein
VRENQILRTSFKKAETDTHHSHRCIEVTKTDFILRRDPEDRGNILAKEHVLFSPSQSLIHVCSLEGSSLSVSLGSSGMELERVHFLLGPKIF